MIVVFRLRLCELLELKPDLDRVGWILTLTGIILILIWLGYSLYSPNFNLWAYLLLASAIILSFANAVYKSIRKKIELVYVQN
jgi:hypothetical protein